MVITLPSRELLKAAIPTDRQDRPLLTTHASHAKFQWPWETREGRNQSLRELPGWSKSENWWKGQVNTRKSN